MEVSLLIRYLGMALGENPNRTETWQLVVDKIRKRLSRWKVNVLSKARHVVLVKYMLNNLPMYYLGLFRMPKAVRGGSFRAKERLIISIL